MRDAIGGIVNIQFIAIFIVLVSSYLAFSVNYTKAFRAKNKIIDVYEAYEGKLDNTGAQDKINSYLKQIGYNPAVEYVTQGQSQCGEGCTCTNLYCYKRVAADNTNSVLSKEYIEVRTYVSIDFPIIKQVLAHIPFFTVKGSSKTVVKYTS